MGECSRARRSERAVSANFITADVRARRISAAADCENRSYRRLNGEEKAIACAVTLIFSSFAIVACCPAHEPSRARARRRRECAHLRCIALDYVFLPQKTISSMHDQSAILDSHDEAITTPIVDKMR